MRRTCQVFVGTKRCGKPAVDFVEIVGLDFSSDFKALSRALTTRIPMCVEHWDEYKKNQDDKR